VNMSNDICNLKGKCNQTCGHASGKESTIHWHVLHHQQLIVNVKGCSGRSPFEKLPQMIVVCIVAANCFQGIN
jgi:hypothetical protein